MANARMAAGGVLGVITDVANTISTTSNTISNGVGIVNDMVQNLKTKREEAYITQMKDFRKNLMKDSALDAVKREENIRSYIGNDEAKQISFNEHYAELEAAYAEYDKAKKDHA